MESQLLCADAIYISSRSERLDPVRTGQVLSDSPKFKNSSSEFLLGVQYVAGESERALGQEAFGTKEIMQFHGQVII